MSRPSLTFLALMSVAVTGATGCSKGPKDRLQGRWIGTSIDNIPADQQTRALGWVRGASMEFRGGQITVVIPAEEPRTGDFRVTRVSGNKIYLEVTRPTGEQDQAVFVMADERTIKWDIGDSRSITFEKVTRLRKVATTPKSNVGQQGCLKRARGELN